MPRPTVLLDVPIRYDVGETVTHAPMVDARAAGVPTRLILDTGSTDHDVMDLVADRLILVDADDDGLVDWLRSRTPDMVPVRLERDASEATPVVEASIEPFAPVATMLNTGGRGTEFAVAAVPDLVGVVPDELGKGVGGDPGDARLPVPHLLIREEIDTMEGLVGMDVLRGTVLAVAADRSRPIVWLVPRDGSG